MSPARAAGLGLAIGITLTLAGGCFLDRTGAQGMAPVDAGDCPPERCNGEDDDCDGRVDENANETCGVPGSCSAGVQRCEDGALGVCVPDSVAGEEECDGALDEDCDDAVDEGCACTPGETRSCGTDLGICEAGTQACEGGTWSACVDAVGPMDTDLCTVEELDEDCDGVANESCECLLGGAPRVCRVFSCEGLQQCVGRGEWGECDVRREMETCNGTDEDCDGTIDEEVCAEPTGCTQGSFGGHAYLFCFASKLNWDDARAACQAVGYELVVIETPEEQAYLQDTTNPLSEADWWIGLRDVTDVDRDYRWVVTEDPPDAYDAWDTNQPTNDNQCAMLDNDLGGRWDDKSCSSKAYICEAPPPTP